jgi:hypothetical protein
MLQGDEEWRRLAGALHEDDAAWLASHDARAASRLDIAAGAVPSVGAVATAPVVVLCTHPELDAATPPAGYRFSREGWPLAALHPDAPGGLAARWRRRLASLVDRFGAQHVAHSVAAVYLTPWPSVVFDAGLVLPSRQRMLALATRVVERDAALVIGPGADAWLAHPPIAALPSTRRCAVDASAGDNLEAATLGAEGWDILCMRIAMHAWL